jgi:N-acetylneuraminic acid mutarotase
MDTPQHIDYNGPMPRVLSAGLLLLVAVSIVAVVVAQTKGEWTVKAPAPTKRTEVVAAAVKGKIYVVGGFQQALSFITPAVEEYDPKTDTWRERAPLPGGLHHAGIGVANDRIYVIGGFEHSFLSIWSPLNTVYEYDSGADRWMVRKPMPTPRGALAVAVLDGKLHAVGGYTRDGNTGAHEVYDPATDTWSSRAPMPTARDHHAAAVVGGRLYAIGGRLNRQYSQNLALTEEYDPAADRWTRKADLPTARSGVTAAVVGDRIYVFGGEAPAGTFRENEAYHPASNAWEALAPMPTARHGLGSAVVDGRIYVLSGGPTPGGSFSNANEMFIPTAPP